MSETNWTEAVEHLNKIKQQYLMLKMPQSTWFVLGQIREMEARFDDGERTDELYNEIMAME